MDPSLAALLPRIREAVALDTPTAPPSDAEIFDSTVSRESLIASVRDALAADERLFADEEAEIAKQVSSAIPRIVSGASAAFDEIRSRTQKEAPWALVPLESELDLLSPMKKERQETAHTLFLSYFLDPRQPHGLGTRALREFFALLGRAIPGEDTFEILSRPSDDNERKMRAMRITAEEVVEVAPAELSDESRRCDIWLELVEETRSLIIVIENKVDAAEHGDQLSAYESAVWQRARSKRHLNFEARLVFLTPDGRPPGDAADKKLWTPISYRELAVALARASQDAPEPGRTMLVLYIASILRHVLRIPARAEGIERIRQFSYLNDVLNSMTGNL